MDALKFLKEGRRICTYYKDCKGCPFSNSDICELLPLSDVPVEHFQMAIKAVESWGDAHPVETFLRVVKSKFPGVVIGEDGTPEFCPGRLFKNAPMTRSEFNDNKGRPKCPGDCAVCWNREKESDEI